MKKKCPLRAAKIKNIDYKDVHLLRQFISDQGQILPRSLTSVSHRMQRKLSNAIKKARYMALIPFVGGFEE